MREVKLSAFSLSIGYVQPPSVLNKDLRLDLYGGELVCLLGPNGVGKSTLMRSLCGLQKPLRGRIDIMGHALSDLSPEIRAKYFAVVLTERLQLGPFCVRDLVGLGRHPHTSGFGKLRPHDQEVIDWAIQSTDIAAIQNQNVNELSDGQRQRVMIARALAQEPQLLFLDEPTAFLDLPGRVEVTKLLKQLARSTQKAILMSTHDLDLALSVADRIWLLGPDGFFQAGAPEDLVLTKAFERVFCAKGIVFDHKRGTFKALQVFSGVIALRGEGLARHWTAHALEREGFKVVSDEGRQDLRVEVLQNGTGWHSRFHGRDQEHASIYALITTIHRLKESIGKSPVSDPFPAAITGEGGKGGDRENH
ncbi:Vitamin B12 ABC transporter, ATP-binding protein BtuD [hydrothermal vent metagenome]|uniref:Vitamin B12 ABC transporter, ATP-binding protein BtuD n=1 Tax=hydrothermal vent metagenome TaxID=652676 RepID=A0A3B1CH76_9ZZZZ